MVRLVAIGPRCDRSAMFATISSSGRIPRSISTRGLAITNDWRISMTRVIIGNRATRGSDQHRCTINRDGRRPMVRSIDRCILRRIVRAIVTSCDRSYDRSQDAGTVWSTVWIPITGNGNSYRLMFNTLSPSLSLSVFKLFDRPFEF